MFTFSPEYRFLDALASAQESVFISCLVGSSCVKVAPEAKRQNELINQLVRLSACDCGCNFLSLFPARTPDGTEISAVNNERFIEIR
jgi:hypothetical protein